MVKNRPANAVDTGSVSGLGRSPGVGNGNPLLYSCLENSMDREARKAMAHGVAKESQLSSWAQQADTRVWGKAAVLIGAWGLPGSVELVAAVSPSRCVRAISGYLLAVSRGLRSAPGGPPASLPCGPTFSSQCGFVCFLPHQPGRVSTTSPVTPDSPPDSCSSRHHLHYSGPR